MDTDWSRDNVCNGCYLMVVTVTAVFFRNTERSHGEPHRVLSKLQGGFFLKLMYVILTVTTLYSSKS